MGKVFKVNVLKQKYMPMVIIYTI